MAIKVKLESSAKTGTFYTTRKNPKNTTKLSLKKFDRKAGENGKGAHVLFNEAKIK